MSELFIEIGTEELPARFVLPALEGLAAAAEKLLAGIPHGAVQTFGTPRRIAVSVVDVAGARPSVERLVTGPPVAADPAPFARARGVAVESLEQADGPKGKVWAFRQSQGGESTLAVVAAGLEDAVLALPFKKSMRWGSGPARFGRPIRHVCAVFGGERIVARVAGLDTVSTTDGHWLLAPDRFEVRGAGAYVSELRSRHVIADVAERRAVIVRGLESAAAAAGLPGQAFDVDLLDEVTNLVEAPSVIEGRFAEELLALPPRLLVESMKVNQRYFPLYRTGADGRAMLTNRFLVVTNNPQGDAALIADGNARVLAARFHDAKFFYAEDRRKPLAQHGERLSGTVWIRGLGSMAERQAVVAEAAAGVAALIGADPTVARAAGALCKCDLATQMVGEFPELQGHVGRLLAEAEGLPADVAAAIEEAYLPRFSGDATPHSPAGRALALAERLTLLSRTFKAGLQPKGSSDPQGLRRAANGIVAIVLDSGWRGPLADLFSAAGEAPTAELLDFVTARLRALLLDEELPTDLVDAVLAADAADLAWAAQRARRLSALARSGAFAPIRATFRRVAGLAKDHASTDYTAAAFEHDTERALHAALAGLPPAGADLDGELAALTAFRPLVDAFFDAVLVMAPDPAVRANRLGLLRAIVARFGRLADFSRLSTD